MKKIYILLFAVFSVVFVSCRTPNQNDALLQVRIGVILPLSGEYRNQAKAALDGMELAVKECNRKGGIDSRPVQLCIYNSGGNPEKAAAIAREIIEKDNIIALIGGYSSTEALQLKLVAEELGVPYVANMATHESLVQEAEYTFQSSLNDEIQGAALAYYIAYRRKFIKPAVMLNIDKSAVYPRGLGRKTAQAWADFSGRSPLLMTYSMEQKSFAEQIMKCIYEDVDVIVLPAYPESAVRFIREARKLGYRGAFAGGDSYDHPAFTGGGEDFGDCFFTTAYYLKNDSSANSAFIKLMQKYYKRNPGYAEAMGYDGVNFLLKGVKNAFTPDETAHNLSNMRMFSSVCGTMDYHERKKIMLHPVFVVKAAAKDSKTVLLWTVDSQQLKNYRNREKY